MVYETSGDASSDNISRTFVGRAPAVYAVKDISTPWEGEAPAEPQAFIDPRKTMRLGGSLALPSTRITIWVVSVQ